MDRRTERVARKSCIGRRTKKSILWPSEKVLIIFAREEGPSSRAVLPSGRTWTALITPLPRPALQDPLHSTLFFLFWSHFFFFLFCFYFLFLLSRLAFLSAATLALRVDARAQERNGWKKRRDGESERRTEAKKLGTGRGGCGEEMRMGKIRCEYESERVGATSVPRREPVRSIPNYPPNPFSASARSSPSLSLSHLGPHPGRSSG